MQQRSDADPGPERQDTFSRFLETLASGLGGTMGTPEELAARAHLSRFHFDRIISATAGEPPVRFRRRILLERAAYRLISTEHGVLDISLDAGYGSHEAFTRAFQRAYGVSPSRWRRRPSKFQLPAPSSVHFHPPDGLRLPAGSEVGSMDLVVRMVEHHIWLIGEMVERAVRLTDDQLDATIEPTIEGIDGDNLRWLLSRMIGQMDMWNAAMADREYDFSIEQGESVLSMRRRLQRVSEEFLAHVREVTAERRFDEMFVEAMTETPVVVTYGGMIAHVLTFSAHHRVLAVSALSGYGVTDLGLGDPKYWVAEAP